MRQIKSIQLTLLLLIISGGCSRMKEIPSPDTFGKTELVTVEINAEGGTAEFDILEVNGITEPVGISFEPPKYGTLTAVQNTSKFRYVAFEGFEETESLKYELCRPGLCKKNQVKIKVSKNPSKPCFPVYSESSGYSAQTMALKGSLVYKYPIHPGDLYCSKNIQKIDSYSSFISSCEIVNDSINITLRYIPLVTTMVGIIKYSNCDTSNYPFECKQRTLNFVIDTGKVYCNSIFRVNNMSRPYKARYSRKVRRADFANQVEACQRNIDEVFFDVFPVSENLQVVNYHDDEDICKILRKKPGANHNQPFILGYIFRNMAGIKDTGQVNVEF